MRRVLVQSASYPIAQSDHYSTAVDFALAMFRNHTILNDQWSNRLLEQVFPFHTAAADPHSTSAALFGRPPFGREGFPQWENGPVTG